MELDADSPFGPSDEVSGTFPPLPMLKRPPTPDETLAMAVLNEQGMTQVELVDLFGFDPKTVRKRLAQMVPEDLEAVRRVVNAELFALGRSTATRYLRAMLQRNPNRLATDRDGNEIEGAYMVSDVDLMRVVDRAIAALKETAGAAGLARSEAGGGSILARWGATEDEFRKVAETLPRGTKLRLFQSVEVDSDSGSVSPDSFSVDS